MVGEAPAGHNRVQNDWFKAHLGQRIDAMRTEDEFITGELVRWDSYSFTLRIGGKEQLLLKAGWPRFREAADILKKGDSNGSR
jgi:hypothetical protein